MRVIQGIVLVPPKKLANVDKLIRLWVHETSRVFCDRLTDDADKNQFLSFVASSCKSHFKVDLDKALGKQITQSAPVTINTLRNLLYGNFMEPDAQPKIYDEIENSEKLEKIMNYYLNEYNSSADVPMNLILFKFAIEHISRMSRVLQMPGGNVLLVGSGGSGRKSDVRLAASIADAELFQFEMMRTYGLDEWRRDIKRLLMHVGITGKLTVFLFCADQAKDEVFIDDVNSLLTASELPNLFSVEEKTHILEAMQNAAKEAVSESV